MSVAPGDVVLRARSLSISARRGGRLTPITDPADLTLHAGEAVAIVGESGSGKSLTVRAFLSLLPPGVVAEGSVEVDGTEVVGASRAALRRVRGSGIALVMQDPFAMLNPLRRCGDQVTAVLRDGDGRRLRRPARAEEARRRLAEVGIDDDRVADLYPFELSGGMQQRVAIAAALAADPSILVADEPTTALDVTTQAEILALLGELRREHDMGLVLVTHDLRVAMSVCDRIEVMYAGSIVESAPAADFARSPRHPYARALLAAAPPVQRRLERLPVIDGSVPAPGSRPPACRFEPRCDHAADECGTAVPDPVQVGPAHAVRCVRVDDVPAAPVTVEGLAGADRERPAERPAEPHVIEVLGARKSYGERVAVDGVDLAVDEGECLGLVGESGSGKTTLARMMVGLTRPDGGTVTVDGVTLGPGLSKAHAERVRSAVQMAFQNPSSTLHPQRSVRSTLTEALRLVDRSRLDERVDELLVEVGLSPSYADRRPLQLSGGERQRVAIARALAREPRVLVCDEIVSALDVSVQAHVLNLLNDLRRAKGIGCVFITHDLAVVRQIADRVCVLKDGAVVETGTASAVLDAPRHPYTRQLIASIPDGVVGSPSPGSGALP